MANIVVMIDPREEEALRSGGVLPRGMFRSFDEIRPDGTPPDDHSVYLWPYPVDYSLGSDSDDPPSLPAMMGLPEAGEEELASESYIARLFGSDVFHVVFLETEDGEKTDGTGFTGRKATFGSLDAVAGWGKRLKEAIEGRLSEEQSKLIRHHLVLVARGGQVVTTPGEAERLQAELEGNPNLHGCFFLDYNLEVEQNNVLLHSRHVWPVMVGRLLLRFLLEGTQETETEAEAARRQRSDMADDSGTAADDPVRAPGVHLWRAREFLFDYPLDRLGEQWSATVKKAYAAVSESTSVTQTANSGGKLFNGKDLELQDFFNDPEGPAKVLPDRPASLDIPDGSWDDAPVDDCVAWAKSDSRWDAPTKDAASRFQRSLFELSHRAWLPADGRPNAVYYSPQAALTKKIFGTVDANPAQVFFKANQIEAKLAGSAPAANPFSAWREALAFEKRRELAKKSAEKAAADMKAAQDHFVPIGVGLLVVAVVSPFCGFSILRVVLALGGGFPLALLLSACAVAGALAACLFVHWRHGARGREALESFVGLCNEPDFFMEKRNEKLFATVEAAARTREISERRNAMSGNLERLKRIRRILGREIQTPSVSVFFIDDKDRKSKPVPDERKRQVELLLSRTRHAEDVSEAVDFKDEDAAKANAEVEKYFPSEPSRRTEGVFFSDWRTWCSETDRGNWGNYPAGYFIPRLRGFMQEVCDRVTTRLKEDVLDKRKKQRHGEGGELPASLRDEMTAGKRTGFTYASAHVDLESVAENGTETLYVAPRFSAEAVAQGSGVEDEDLTVKTSRTFSVLPHYAFYYQDIPVRLACEVRKGKDGKGRLVFR